jgi:hypothetical protein
LSLSLQYRHGVFQSLGEDTSFMTATILRERAHHKRPLAQLMASSRGLTFAQLTEE